MSNNYREKSETYLSPEDPKPITSDEARKTAIKSARFQNILQRIAEASANGESSIRIRCTKAEEESALPYPTKTTALVNSLQKLGYKVRTTSSDDLPSTCFHKVEIFW